MTATATNRVANRATRLGGETFHHAVGIFTVASLSRAGDAVVSHVGELVPPMDIDI
jgi:hypothetical protein